MCSMGVLRICQNGPALTVCVAFPCCAESCCVIVLAYMRPTTCLTEIGNEPALSFCYGHLLARSLSRGVMCMKSVEIERLVGDLAELSPARRVPGFSMSSSPGRATSVPQDLQESDGGVSIDDCVRSQRSRVSDRDDRITGSYALQVSSPGEMPLRAVEDYRRFAPRYARIEMYSPVNGSKMHEGYLAGVSDGNLMLKKGDEVVALPLDKVSRARLAVP